MSRKCAALKPTPLRAGRSEALSIGRFRPCMLPAECEARAEERAPQSGSGLDRLQRTHALGCLDGVAGPPRHILPGIALVVGARGAGAGCPGARRAIVITLQRDAVAFVH